MEPMKTTHPDLLRTAKLPALTMAELVYGPRPAKRYCLPTRVIFVAAVLGTTLGCRATIPPAPDTDTVGQLAAGPSVYSAPVHATTDLTPQFGAVESGDDVSSEVTTVTRAPDAGPDAEPDGAELPEVAPKDQGLKVGEVR
jgi:hypothetical protein